MINKREFSINNDKKILHKIGKKWVVISAFLLMALGAAGAETTVHAQNANEANARIPVTSQAPSRASGRSATKAPANSAASSGQNIMNVSRAMHGALVRNAGVRPSAQQSNSTLNRSRTSQNNANVSLKPSGQQATNVADNHGSSLVGPQDQNNHAKGSVTQSLRVSQGNAAPTLNHVSGPAESGLTDAADQSSFDPFSPLINENWPSSYSDATPVTFMLYPQNGLLVFESGPLPWNGSNSRPFIGKNMSGDELKISRTSDGQGGNELTDFENAKYVEFQSDMKLPASLKNMFRDDANLRAVKFDAPTGNVSDMSGMFASDPNLSDVELGPKWSTWQVHYMTDMFANDPSLKVLTLPNEASSNNKFTYDYGSIAGMFKNDNNLRQINVPKDPTNNIKFVIDGTGLPGLWKTVNSSTGVVSDRFQPTRQSLTNRPPYHLLPTYQDRESINKDETIAPQPDEYSDVYKISDGLPAPQNGTRVPSGWTYVNANGVITTTPQYSPVTGKVLVAPTYDGLAYHYNRNTGAVDFTGGTMQQHTIKLNDYDTANTFLMGAPPYLQDASSITFSPGVNMGQVSDMNYMLSFAARDYNNDNDPVTFNERLRSVDLTNLDTSHVKFMGHLFQNDRVLSDIKLDNYGPNQPTRSSTKFSTVGAQYIDDMFNGDSALTSLTLPTTFDTRASYDNPYGQTYLLYDPFDNTLDNSMLNLKKLTIKSPDFEINNNAILDMPALYQRTDLQDSDTETADPNGTRDSDYYTQVYIHRFTQANMNDPNDVNSKLANNNVGVFLETPRIQQGKIKYVDILNGQTIATKIIPKSDEGYRVKIQSLPIPVNRKDGSNYYFVDPQENVPLKSVQTVYIKPISDAYSNMDRTIVSAQSGMTSLANLKINRMLDIAHDPYTSAVWNRDSSIVTSASSAINSFEASPVSASDVYEGLDAASAASAAFSNASVLKGVAANSSGIRSNSTRIASNASNINYVSNREQGDSSRASVSAASASEAMSSEDRAVSSASRANPSVNVRSLISSLVNSVNSSASGTIERVVNGWRRSAINDSAEMANLSNGVRTALNSESANGAAIASAARIIDQNRDSIADNRRSISSNAANISSNARNVAVNSMNNDVARERASSNVVSAYSSASRYDSYVASAASVSIASTVASINNHIDNSYNEALNQAQRETSSAQSSAIVQAGAAASNAYRNASSYADSLAGLTSASISRNMSLVNAKISSVSRSVSSRITALSASANTGIANNGSVINTANDRINRNSNGVKSLSVSTNAGLTSNAGRVSNLSRSASDNSEHENDLSNRVTTVSNSASQGIARNSASVNELSGSVRTNSQNVLSNRVWISNNENSVKQNSVNAANSAVSVSAAASRIAARDASNAELRADTSASASAEQLSSVVASSISATMNSINNRITADSQSASVSATRAYSAASSSAARLSNAASASIATSVDSINARFKSDNARIIANSANVNQVSLSASAASVNAQQSAKSYVNSYAGSLSSAALKSIESSITSIDDHISSVSASASVSALNAYASASSYAGQLSSNTATSITHQISSVNAHVDNSYRGAVASAKTDASDAERSAEVYASSNAVSLNRKKADRSSVNSAVASLSDRAPVLINNVEDTSGVASNAAAIDRNQAAIDSLNQQLASVAAGSSAVAHYRRNRPASIRTVHDVNELGVGKTGVYKGVPVARISAQHHYVYLWITKALQLHTDPIFSWRNAVKVLKPSQHLTLMIQRIFVVRDHGVNRVRYEVRIDHHDYFITGNPEYVGDSYWQAADLRKRRTRWVEVYRPICEYTSPHYVRKARVRVLKRGATLKIKRVIDLNRHHLTRIELTNGDYITANKNFVKLI